MNNFFKDKKILITQSSLRQFAGSELVVLELADYLQKNKAKVMVYTWFYSDPIKTEFNKKNISVTTDPAHPFFKDLDYVWAHHQVLPSSLISRSSKKSPIYFFYHMSALDYAHIEQPYIYHLEKNLASNSVFVSKEALNTNQKKFPGSFCCPTIIPNFMPPNFNHPLTKHQPLHKILVVSNHPPEEVIKAISLLKNAGYETTIIGRTSDNYQLITPEILSSYDVIVTIGKTVQYCLGLNIPIFLYDHCGGCGYLSLKDYDKALYANFSGRGFSKKSPFQIFNEVIEGYNSAINFQSENHSKFISDFDLNTNLLKLFKKAKRRKHKFSEDYVNYILSAEAVAQERTVYDSENKALMAKKQSASRY